MPDASLLGPWIRRFLLEHLVSERNLARNTQRSYRDSLQLLLPAIARQVGKRATVLMDSGVRSGSDVVRACALGAGAAFAGKAFLWGLGALGEQGPGHVIDLLIEETQAALGQLGVHDVDEARSLAIRHERELQF